MTQILQPDAVLALRMRALGLAGGIASGPDAGNAGDAGAVRIAAVAEQMLALQGQDWRSARWALGVRAPGTVVADVHDAFNTGRLVRSWPMRGTLHLVAARDIAWIQGVTNHRVLAGAPARRTMLELSDDTLDRLVDVSLAALRGGTALDRDQLSTAWTEAGVQWHSGWRYHVIWWLCQNGLATFGPVRDTGEPLLVRTDEWITDKSTLTGDDALAALATRYVRGRGPVREQDFAWWTGLTVREARRGLELAAETGALAPARLAATDGPKLWVDSVQLEAALRPGHPDATAGPRWQLLPAFDEHLLGYADRTQQLAPDQLASIVPGRNGMFLATAVADGRVRGTWKRGSRVRSGVELTPLPHGEIDLAGLAEPIAAWHAFHGTEPYPSAVLSAPESPAPKKPRSAKQ